MIYKTKSCSIHLDSIANDVACFTPIALYHEREGEIQQPSRRILPWRKDATLYLTTALGWVGEYLIRGFTCAGLEASVALGE